MGKCFKSWLKSFRRARLDFVESGNINGLDIVLKSGDLLLQEIRADLVVLDNATDLEFLDTISNGNKFRSTPQETISLNLADFLLQLGHVGLIVPWFNIQENIRLGNENTLLCLLSRLALIISCNTLGLEFFSGCIIFFVVRSKEINVIIVLFFLDGGSGLR